MQVPIDLVYTWVDGSDPEHFRLRQSFSQNPQDLNPERYRDPHQLLRYSLRSVERFAPWIGQIFLLTQRPQRPEWLQLDHPRVRLLHHDEIFEDTSVLPVFNSHPIESYLHRVPTASDYFLYLNDDMLFARPTSRADFLSPEGRIRVWGAMAHRNLADRLLNLRIDPGWIEHCPLLIHRGHFQAALQSLPPGLLEEIRRSRFRAHPNFVLLDAYRRYLLNLPSDQREIVPAHQVVHWHRLLRLQPGFQAQCVEQRKAFAMRPGVLCINDDEGENPDPRTAQRLRQHLENLFPRPGRFERDPRSATEILLVHPSFQPPGGGNGVAAWMLQALAAHYRVTVLTWGPQDWEAVNAYFGTSLVPTQFGSLQVHPGWRRALDWIPSWPGSLLQMGRFLRQARQISESGGYDLVIGSHSEADFGRAGLQYVHFPRSYHPWHHVDPIWYRWPLRALLMGLDRLSHAWAGYRTRGMLLNCTLCNSTWTGRLFEGVHGVVPRVLYPPAAGEFPPVDWADRKPGLISIGRFAEDKRPLWLFAIAQGLRQRGLDWPLHLVGSPDSPALTEQLRRLAREHASWFFLHENLPRPRLSQLLREYRYGLHAMAEEHFGMAVAEMVRAGCLVFVPRGGGQVEIVDQQEPLTYLSVEEAVDKIYRVHHDPSLQDRLRQCLGERAQEFHPETFMRRFLGVVEECLRA